MVPDIQGNLKSVPEQIMSRRLPLKKNSTSRLLDLSDPTLVGPRAVEVGFINLFFLLKRTKNLF